MVGEWSSQGCTQTVPAEIEEAADHTACTLNKAEGESQDHSKYMSKVVMSQAGNLQPGLCASRGPY